MIIRICIVLCIYYVFCIVPPCIPQPSHSQCLMEWEAADTMFYRILRHNTDHSGEYANCGSASHAQSSAPAGRIFFARAVRVSVRPSATRRTVPDAHILTVFPFYLYGQHTSSRLPTRLISNFGATSCCATSTLSEIPAASRRARSATARAFAVGKNLTTIHLAVASSALAVGVHSPSRPESER